MGDAPKIVFPVEDIASAREELLTLGVKIGEHRSGEPGIQVADAVDPEGNKLGIEGKKN